MTDARSNATSYVRDGFGDAIQVTSPDAGVTVNYFDAAGRMTKSTDARSVETDYTYDNADRMLTRTFPASSGENVTYSYDSTTGGNKGIGRLTGIADASGSTAYSYDAVGRATQDGRTIGSNTYNIAYSYDAAGHVLTATYPSGRIVTYARDSEGRISGITTKETSVSSPVTVVSSVTHKPFGPLASLTFGNSVALTLTWDQDYQLTDIDAASGGTTIQDLTYGYDAASNITSITDHLASGRTQAFTYDNLNRLASASGLYGSLSFTYDGVGNRLTRVLGGVTDTYAYPSTSNRLGTVTTGSNVRSFTYLGNGSTSDDVRDPSNDYSYTFNNAARLVTAKLNASTVGSYVYNALEQRAAKTAVGSTIQFVYDSAGHLIEEADATSGTAIREYIWLDDIPVALVDHSGMSPVLYYIHTDHLNRPQKITDGSVAVVWDGVFDPFGNAASVTGSITNPLRFPGQYQDSESSLAQNWFRDYDSTLGRYSEGDPTGINNGPNLFGYVFQRPTFGTDSSGLATTVTVWDPRGVGESSFGHVSTDINNQNFSFGPNGWDRKFPSASDYNSRQTSFRGGYAYHMNLSPSQERALQKCLLSHKEPYHFLFNNCATPIRECLDEIGVSVPYSLLPSSFGYSLESTPGFHGVTRVAPEGPQPVLDWMMY